MGETLGAILSLLGDRELARAPHLSAWIEHARALGGPAELARLTRAYALAEAIDHHQPIPAVRLGPNAREHFLRTESPIALAAAELALEGIAGLDDGAFRDRIATDTLTARAALESLRDETEGRRMRALFPELAALAVLGDRSASIEHEPSREPNDRALPLLEHLADRALGRKLRGLELADRALFQRDGALSDDAFDREAAKLARLRAAGLLPAVRTAMLVLDFAKGGSTHDRARWEQEAHADLSVHNLAARKILEHFSVLESFPLFRGDRALRALVLALVESHGLTGQAVRGETPLPSFAPFVAHLRGLADPNARRLAIDALHAVNVADTAAVREGLLGDALLAALSGIEETIAAVAAREGSCDPREIERELAYEEDAIWRARAGSPDPSEIERDAGAKTADGTSSVAGRTERELHRARLADRLARLRKTRLDAGEPRSEVEAAVASISEPALLRLSELLARCQLWYVEPATAAFSPRTQLAVLALAASAARHAGIDTASSYHITFLPLVAPASASTPYRVRLVEAALSEAKIEDILELRGPAAHMIGEGADAPIVGFETEIARSKAIAIAARESEEAGALLTLLPIYEKKSSAAFHATLKALCDLYGLRKDELDRVANEALYLVHMNSARTDKSRMLDYARPGRIVEIGPGGGVVLDLLAERFPDSEVIGIDLSKMVIDALHARKQREQRRWEVIEGDAYELTAVLGGRAADTIVFCSVLHEIYSYVERPSRFSLESVRDVLLAAYRALVPGGRIIIRDGVIPPPATRIIRFIAEDAAQYFALFAEQFEGRKIIFERLAPDRVRLSSGDAMEFLYKYTWGAASFPYEIREQYGVLEYEAYRRAIAGWLEHEQRRPRLVPLPAELASYLQRGYAEGLAGKVELQDERGRQVELPDSNCLIVVEKT